MNIAVCIPEIKGFICKILETAKTFNKISETTVGIGAKTLSEFKF